MAFGANIAPEKMAEDFEKNPKHGPHRTIMFRPQSPPVYNSGAYSLPPIPKDDDLEAMISSDYHLDDFEEIISSYDDWEAAVLGPPPKPIESQPPFTSGGWELQPHSHHSLPDDYIHARGIPRPYTSGGWKPQPRNNYSLPDDYIHARGLPPKPKGGINIAQTIADPDGDSSSLCSACTLPVFSTPSVSLSHSECFLHEQCAHLSKQVLHELHPRHALLLNRISTPPPICCNCNRICGTSFYQCPCSDCDFRLDLLCVVQIKIVHRSHHHTMMVIRQREASSLTCSACDTKHDPSSLESTEMATLSYLCNLCGYWVHPDCASFLNVIVRYQDHRHCLFLTYKLPNATHSECLICHEVPKRSSGVCICLNCPDYLVHIRCALTRPNSFKPVFIREAKVADLCRLPFLDENTSLIPYIRESSSSSSSSDNHLDLNLHPHPLIFHKTDDDNNQSTRVCNACAQSISPPFFSCAQCPHFFLHSCCAHLPTKIEHRVHEHALFLSPKALKSDISAGFTCKGCKLRCNGFAYSCKDCDDFTMDVACAFINPAITHASHKKTHILFMCRDVQFRSDQSCNCCRSELSGICYECSICSSFKLHVRCALLPRTVRHVFDDHSLQLITTGVNGEGELCEVCEKEMETKQWYYSCGRCNQSFHVDCIPCVDQLSRMKLGSTVRVGGHECDVALVREDDVVCGGHRCGHCGQIFKSLDDGLAYECSSCYFGIHHHCAQKRLLKS